MLELSNIGLIGMAALKGVIRKLERVVKNIDSLNYLFSAFNFTFIGEDKKACLAGLYYYRIYLRRILFLLRV